MPYCFVPNCKSGYKKAKKAALFSPPKIPECLNIWKFKIPRKDKELTTKDKVCELHFAEDDIIRWYEHKLPDGRVDRIPRDRLRLREGAIPKIFPNCPSYMTDNSKKRKLPLPRGPVKLKEKRKKTVPILEVETTEISIVEFVDQTQTHSNITFSFNEINDVVLPDLWSYSKLDNKIVFLKWSSGHQALERRLLINETFETQIFIYDTKIYLKNHVKIQSTNHLMTALHDISAVRMCTSDNRIKACRGFIQEETEGTYCATCKYLTNLRRKTFRRAKKFCNRSIRMKKKNKKYEMMLQLQRKSANKDESELIDKIAKLPPEQKQNVLACFEAAKVTNKHAIRYTSEWIYQCVLLKLKGNSMYEYIRRHNIMALPSLSTVYRYVFILQVLILFMVGTLTVLNDFLNADEHICKFIESTFQLLKKKSDLLQPGDRRGCILLDEMKLTPYVYLNRDTLRIHGFTDLGKYTPSHQANVAGDHALVLMFQPFCGQWVQPIAAFLSKGAASGTVLTQILLEAIVLMENSNFFVDAIVCDGAEWNRAMWRQFGATPDNPFCGHVYDDKRKLYFVSDFPHLIKNLRNWVIKQTTFQNPDGIVDKQDWSKLIMYDEQKHGRFGIKLCPKLTMEHINPKHYDKMNVAKAYQFFGLDVAAAMDSLNMKNRLEFQEGTIKFIYRVSNLIKAMGSRCSKGALWLNSTEHTTIVDFLEYLKKWKDSFSAEVEQQKKEKEEFDELFLDENQKIEDSSNSRKIDFLTKNTYEGFLATLGSTLQISMHLIKECNYRYFMTSRINQDNLERFFGMIRNHGGNNDHPNSLVFIQIYRLLSCYSLIKTQKGSNVTGAETLKTLTEICELKKNQPHDDKIHWTFNLDQLVDQGVDLSEYDSLFDGSMDALEFFAGYVARRSATFTTCTLCAEAVRRTYENPADFTYLTCRNYCNGLVVPSEEMIQICNIVEKTIKKVTEDCNGNVALDSDTLFKILYAVVDQKITLVGCSNEDHKSQFSKKIINFVLITRMLFFLKEMSKSLKNNKTKGLRKTGKY